MVDPSAKAMGIYSYVTDPEAIRSVAGARLAASAGAVILPVRPARDQPPLAIVLDVDPLDHHGDRCGLDLEAIARSPVANVVLWTGSLAPEPFARDIQTWGTAGRIAFDDLRQRIEQDLEGTNVRVLWRPHARHVISDAQRALSLVLEESDRRRFGLALDLTSLLEPSMLAAGADHIARALEALGSGAALIIATGARARNIGRQNAPENAEPAGDLPPVQAVAAHEGAVDPSVLGSLLRGHVPAGTPLVLLGENLDAQMLAMGLVEGAAGA